MNGGLLVEKHTKPSVRKPDRMWLPMEPLFNTVLQRRVCPQASTFRRSKWMFPQRMMLHFAATRRLGNIRNSATFLRNQNVNGGSLPGWGLIDGPGTVRTQCWQLLSGQAPTLSFYNLCEPPIPQQAALRLIGRWTLQFFVGIPWPKKEWDNDQEWIKKTFVSLQATNIGDKTLKGPPSKVFSVY